MLFFQLFQYYLGPGKPTIGDFSSEQLLHDPLNLCRVLLEYDKIKRVNVRLCQQGELTLVATLQPQNKRTRIQGSNNFKGFKEMPGYWEYLRQKCMNCLSTTQRPFKGCFFTAGLCSHNILVVRAWIAGAIMLRTKTVRHNNMTTQLFCNSVRSDWFITKVA